MPKRCEVCGKELPDNWMTSICADCAFEKFKSFAAAGGGFKGKAFLQEAITSSPTVTTSTSREAQLLKKYGELDITFLTGIFKDKFVLGKMLNEGFSPDMLYHPATRKIAELLVYFYKQGKSWDRFLVQDFLKRQNELTPEIEEVLDLIVHQPPVQLGSMMEYLARLRERASIERLKLVRRKIDDYIDGKENTNTPVLEFVNILVRDLREIQKAHTGQSIKLIKSELIEIAKEIEERAKTGEIETLGYSLQPYNDLNLALSGLRKGFFYAIAGAPRRGKTSLTLELATTVARNEKIPVLFFSWEQTRKTLTYRILAKESRINPDTLRRKDITKNPELMERFAAGWKKMEEYMDYFYIMEGSKKDTVDRIKAYAYNAMEIHGTDDIVIFLDYLQKMPYPKEYSTERFKIEEISTDIKRLTIELNCPIVVISSLTREGCELDSGPGKGRPTMYHTKGSGDIEYDLDVAMILAKDWEDTAELENQLRIKAREMGKDPENVPKIDIVNLYLDKNRDAPEGYPPVVQFFFFIEENKFVELGFKGEEDKYRYARIDRLLNKLIETGMIRFRDKQDLKTGALSAARKKAVRIKRDADSLV